jgi:PAS domain S-box-containing protein
MDTENVGQSAAELGGIEQGNLLKTGALQRAIFNSANFSSIATDAKGIIQIFNVGAERMLGYTAAEVMNRITPADLSDPQEVIARANALSVELGTPITPGFEALVFKASRGIEDIYELTYIRKDGSRFPALVSVTALRDAEGGVIGYLLIGTDNTARKRAEEQMAAGGVKALADFKAALDEHAIVAITDARGKITYANDRFCTISKYPREELRGQDHRIINSGHHPKAFFQKLWETIKSGLVWRGELKNRAKDGSFYWVDTTIVPFLDEHGKPTQFIAIRADITERKQAEETIVRLNAELRAHAAQLEATNKELEAFAYSVSHDLRAPLRGMDGFSQALLEDYAGHLDATGQDYLRRIRAAAQRMGHLIDDLLKLAQVTRSEMVLDPVDLTALAHKAIAELQPQQAGRTVEWDISESLTALGDPRLLHLVLENLLANALKFSGKCEHARIEFGEQAQGAEQVFFVRDNGAGFDMAYASRLFGAFQRLHNPHEFPGTGIGLATVQRIIHRHGGRVWAEAQPGKGATFSFTLETAN